MIHIYQLLYIRIPFFLIGGIDTHPTVVTFISTLMVQIGISRVVAIIRNAGLRTSLVCPMSFLKPCKTSSQMFTDTKRQSLFLCRFLPFAHYITLWSHIDRIPFMELRVP